VEAKKSSGEGLGELDIVAKYKHFTYRHQNNL